MSALNAKNLGYLAAATALLSLIVAQGCGDDDDSQAAPGAAGKAAAGASAGGSDSGGKSDAGDTSESGGKTSTPAGGSAGAQDTGSAGDKGEGGEGGAGADCSGPSGCYSCAPTTNIQFLNSCVEGGCPAHFDNSTLTKLNLVGTL